MRQRGYYRAMFSMLMRNEANRWTRQIVRHAHAMGARTL